MQSRHIAIWTMGFVACGACELFAAETFQAGFARVDITPQEPVRLSGYAARSTPMEGVDGPLFARAFVMKSGDGPLHVLVAVDSIGMPGVISKEVFEALPADVREDRARFVMTATHSHTAPHVARGLTNLFTQPQSETELAATERYTNRLRDGAIEAARAAIADLKPARVYVGEGEVGFARNRRVVVNQQWAGFGEAPQGPVDHSAPVLKITEADGRTIRGFLFNYACHCTTFGPGHNLVNGDWAGYASTNLERDNPGATAICTIGCGADANPEREGPEQLSLSRKQGRELSDEVTRISAGGMRKITAAPAATFGYAGLPIDRPTLEDLNERLKSGDPNVRRHAELMLDVHRRMGRLPETYPMPIQGWRFGDELAMVFLGGEVVVDYALRIKREYADAPAGASGAAPAPDADAARGKIRPPLWITAYANDVFGYVASERIRGEGGYEVDGSMIYYSQPGRWSTGTEEVVMRRVHELIEGSTTDRALSVDEALKSFSVPEGFSIEALAAEPLVQDPINLALGPDGRLWVVEMGDYPRGLDGNGQAGGRIKVLTDVDQDGRFDHAVTFLDGLVYPTGVWPWRDGAIVSAAPDVFFAKDSDGDGVADVREDLFSGFVESNPQHRVSGFAYGLDGWLYLASGETSQDILCRRTGATINMAGRDLRIDPDSGRMETLSGKSQYGRVRDDWGNWFGNNNSEPLYQYVIEDSDLRRNPYVASPNPIHHLPDPPATSPVFPTSRTMDRYNDLWSANCFTSACSPLIVRDERLSGDLNGAALVCEPVHNLVCRLLLEPEGVSFRGVRHAAEQQSEFLSSSDGWFRPVRTLTAPDGSLWIVDMYRKVIEHPEWIPEAWQAQLNLRAGEDRGRIYRLARSGQPRSPLPDLTRLSTAELVGELVSPNGWRRDMAQQLLTERRDSKAPAMIDEALRRKSSPAARIQQLWTRCTLDRKHMAPLIPSLQADSPAVRRAAVRLLGATEPENEPLRSAILERARDSDLRVRYELALVLGGWTSPVAGDALAALAATDFDDPWMRAAILSSSRGCAERVLADVLQHVPPTSERTDFVASLTSTALGDDPRAGAARIFRLIAAGADNDPDDWKLAALSACLDGLDRGQIAFAALAGSSEAALAGAARGVSPLFQAARTRAIDPSEPVDRRRLAVALLGRGANHRSDDLDLLSSLLTPQQPVDIQSACIRSLGRSGDDSVSGRLISAWSSLEPSVRYEVLGTMLSRVAWTRSLLEGLEDGRIRPSELDASSRSRLIEHPDDDLRERATVVFQPPAARQEVLDQYRSVGALSGDAGRGALLFQKTCAACHRLHDRGKDVGARLSALQNKATDNLLLAILDPNRGVEGKFLSYTAATRDGRIYAGQIVEETATSITLARPDGQQDVLLRIDLDSLSSSGKSFMPEGLEKELSPQDLADVIAFVQADSVAP